jgi:hypothetical protein
VRGRLRDFAQPHISPATAVGSEAHRAQYIRSAEFLTGALVGDPPHSAAGQDFAARRFDSRSRAVIRANERNTE